MTLRIPAKVLLHVWSYDFYDMTLSTGKQRRHMINDLSCQESPELGSKYPFFTAVYALIKKQSLCWHFLV